LLKNLGPENKIRNVILDLNPVVWSQYRTRTTNDWIINNEEPFQKYVFELCFELCFLNYVLFWIMEPLGWTRLHD
jgi:hypothetical protein